MPCMHGMTDNSTERHATAMRAHLSVERSGTITVRSSRQTEHASYKPAGFWYDVDGAWEEFCKRENFGDVASMTRYIVRLGAENVLHIDSAEKLVEFDREYGEDNLIRWDKVADKFDGIEISPYRWEHRLSMIWYYGWDISSGVIWRPNGVSVKVEDR